MSKLQAGLVAITFTTKEGQVKDLDKLVLHHRVNRSWMIRKLLAKALVVITDEEIEKEIMDDPKSAPQGWGAR